MRIPRPGRKDRRYASLAVLSFALTMVFTLIPSVATAQTAVLLGNHPQKIDALISPAPPNLLLDVRISFSLRNRPELEKLLTDLQDRSSPRYHRWLTPTEFDSRFGRTPAEVNAVSKWLSGRGFHINSANVREIQATASATLAENTFSTTITASSDASLYANQTDPRIPARFAGVIGSIGGLDNLHHWFPTGIRATASRKQAPRAKAKLAISSLNAGSKPEFSTNAGEAFGPQDVYSFYDENPLLDSGIDGSGATPSGAPVECGVAVVEDSDYADASVALFDTTFALPTPSITRVPLDPNPPIVEGSEQEALLDIEWSHAVAPGAGIMVYIAVTGDEILRGIEQAVTDNACGAISISFSDCGVPATYYTNTLDPWLVQAAMQGQSVFVSSGDYGAAGYILNTRGTECVPGISRNVSETSADPNVTAVGGTEFTPNYGGGGDDLGFVAERAWDDPFGATGGGMSVVFPKPSFQKNLTPDDQARDVPDVAYGASPTNPGFFFGDDTDGSPVLETIGGTSIAAPMWAGLSRLVAQTIRTPGCDSCPNPRLGNMDPQIYQLGAFSDSSSSGLRDVISGDNSYNDVTGFSAGPGYDQTTGWGTADMATFVSAYTSGPVSTPSASPSSTAKPTPSSSATATSTAVPTPSSSASPTVSATPGSPTPVQSPTMTPVASPTPMPSETPTPVATGTPPPSSPTPSPAPSPVSSPAGPMAVTPKLIRFGMHPVGSETSVKIVDVVNPEKRGQPLVIASVGTTTSQFVIDPGLTTCNSGTGIGKKSRCKVAIFFRPSATGKQIDQLTIQSNAINQPQIVRLEGTGKQ
jgi:subtilase family serine protease